MNELVLSSAVGKNRPRSRKIVERWNYYTIYVPHSSPIIEALKLDQQQDELVKPMTGWLKGKPPTKKELRKSLPATRILWRHKDSLMFMKGVLYKRLLRNRGLQPTLHHTLVLPQSWIQLVLEELHDEILAGHMGTERTFERIHL